MRKHYKSRFPAANVSRLNEVVATDTYVSDTPALDVRLLGHGGTKWCNYSVDVKAFSLRSTLRGVKTIFLALLKISSVNMVHRIPCLVTMLSLK
jgi:hypothetical protein